MDRIKMQRTLDGKRYDTEKATLIASDVYWNSQTWERSGRNHWLYRTPNGRYFVVTGTYWVNEHNSLEPLSVDEALYLYENVYYEHQVDYEIAFPEMKVEDA